MGAGATRLNEIGYKIKQLAFSWPAVPGADTYRLLENPDGVSGYTQIGSDFTAVTTSYDYDISVHLQDWANASYLLQSCVGADCTISAERTATNSGAAIGYFKASNTGMDDNFGHAVAVSDDGDTVVVGAWGEDSVSAINQDDNSGNDVGAVYVFNRTADVWEGPVYLKAGNVDSGDEFGFSVSLSLDGNTLAVGARNEAGPTNIATGAGAVYIFVRNTTSGDWSQTAYLRAENADTGDNFGQAVALSDDGYTLAVGAPGEDGNGVDGETNNNNTDSGAVYVFARNNVAGNDWTQQAYLKASVSDPLLVDAFSGFGHAVAISGNGMVLATGAWQEDVAANPQQGAVYLFSYNTVWDTGARLLSSNAEANDRFGTSVALSTDGTTLAVGAYLEDGLDNGAQNDSGAAYLFVNSGGWSEQAYIKPEVVDADDQFGISVAIGGASGTILAVGANGEASAATAIGGDPLDGMASNAGAAYIFTHDAVAGWSQGTYIKAPNSDANDLFGTALNLSADGKTLVVGAVHEQSSARGIGGDQTDNSITSGAGAVYLY